MEKQARREPEVRPAGQAPSRSLQHSRSIFVHFRVDHGVQSPDTACRADPACSDLGVGYQHHEEENTLLSQTLAPISFCLPGMFLQTSRLRQKRPSLHPELVQPSQATSSSKGSYITHHHAVLKPYALSVHTQFSRSCGGPVRQCWPTGHRP